jgi:hypothetical protein
LTVHDDNTDSVVVAAVKDYEAEVVKNLRDFGVFSAFELSVDPFQAWRHGREEV